MRKLTQLFTDDELTFRAFSALLVLVLLLPVWWNPFLPMQDYPQHLFMAWVSNTYNDPGMDWSESFELRNLFGPYRATFLAQKLLIPISSVESSGKILASIYILLVGALVFQSRKLQSPDNTGWGALLFFPLCLHPMYFYGFLNFTISIPVFIIVLLDLKKLISDESGWVSAVRHSILLLFLFLLHPFTLLVYSVLACASIPILARNKAQLKRAMFSVLLALGIFLGWMLYSSPDTGASIGLASARLRWWPLEWNVSFLAMMFTGMRISQNPVWLIAGLWAAMLLIILLGAWYGRNDSKLGLWTPALFCLALAGYFALPFSVQTDARFTFFGTRMAPIVFFLLTLVIAEISMGKFLGRAVATLCLALTTYSAYLYDRVSHEVAAIVPIIEKMESGASVLPLIVRSPSAFLDPMFYAQFHYSSPFYYHVIKGGGVNPDLFNNRLMPVVFQAGKRPERPSQRAFHEWIEYAQYYDYVIAQHLPRPIRRQLDYNAQFLGSSGPWSLYRLKNKRL